MSDPSQEVKFSLKVMINKQKNKVLFAEADNEFTDVLLSFLSLPLVNILKILDRRYIMSTGPVFGSITTLYNGLLTLDNPYVLVMCGYAEEINRQTALGAECLRLKLNIGMYPEINRESSKPRGVDNGYCGGVFTDNTASFVISDDLRIEPVVPGHFLSTLMKLGITDTDGAELRNLTLGSDEIMDLLLGSLYTMNPLSNLVLCEWDEIDSVKSESLPLSVEKAASSNYKCKKITVKVVVQKSTNKVLFAEAGVDFINFLSSFLTIPLGGIEYIFGGNACLKNIDNLYKSVANIDGDAYLNTKNTKSILLSRIPENKMSSFHIDYLSPVMYRKGSLGYFDRRKSMYQVTDDLTVTPFGVASGFSILSGLKVPLSDVKEMEMEIGFEETVNIFRASLASTSALTNGLMKNLSLKQPKEEH